MNINIKKKSISVFILFLLMLFATAGCSSGSNSASEGQNADGSTDNEQYTLRISHPIAEDHPIHIALTEFKEELESKSEGSFRVEIFPSGQLYSSEREAFEAVQLNNIEMAIGAPATIAGFKSEFSIFSLPFLFNDREAAYRALDGELGQKLNDMLLDVNLYSLGYGELGFRNFLNNKGPIEKPEDFSGLKLRVIESKIFEDMFNTLGANASPMGFGEVYTAIQQGVFDGMDSEITLISAAKLDEVVNYLTLSGHTFTPLITVANKDFVENLPADLKELLVTTMDDVYNKRERELNVQQENERLEQLKNTMEVNELTTEQKEEFRKALQPVYDKYADEIGQELIELAEASNE